VLYLASKQSGERQGLNGAYRGAAQAQCGNGFGVLGLEALVLFLEARVREARGR
jgi:hypothetical protein